MENLMVKNLPAEREHALCLNTFGHSVTHPGHRFGPSVRSYYLIHFILDGEGEFQTNHTKYHLKKGQGFLIEPDYLTTYTSDMQHPWTYVWVGFSGKNAKQIVDSLGLSQENPVFSCDAGEKLKKYVLEMLQHNHLHTADFYRTQGMFYLFISAIADAMKDQISPTDANTYVQHAISYIHNHIGEPILVEEIADYVGLNRSYLSVLFKKSTGMSPIQYLQTCRLTKARNMLATSNLSVESIACSCGYQKAESLIKVFRQTYHTTPAAYRKEITTQI